MTELTNEQEELLEDLLDRAKAGIPSGEYIHRMRQPHLNPELEYGLTGRRYTVSDEYEAIEPLLESLKNHGLLEPFHFDGATGESFPYGNLTSEGRCFFEKRESLAREARKKRWGERMWQVFIAVLGVVLSVIASIVTVNIKLGQ